MPRSKSSKAFAPLRPTAAGLFVSTLPNILYHYTSQGGLFGILKGQKLWATNINYLNDTTEFTLAFLLAAECLKQGRCKFKNKGCVDQVVDLLERMLSPGDDIYVCSFSTEKDDLSQWRGYCAGGIGYAIGFDGKGLDKVARNQKLNAKKRGLRLAPFELVKCEYSNNPYVDRLTESLVRAIDTFVSSNGWDEAKLKLLIKSEAIAYLAFIKHEKFKAEQEWRLASLANDVEKSDKIDFREGKSMMIPHFEFSFLGNKKIVKEIWIGPTPNADLAESAVKKFLFRHGYVNVDVKRSAIPFRNW